MLGLKCHLQDLNGILPRVCQVVKSKRSKVKSQKAKTNPTMYNKIISFGLTH